MKKQLENIQKFIDLLFTDGFNHFVAGIALLCLLTVFGLNIFGILEPVESRLVDLRFQARNRFSEALPSILTRDTVSRTSSKVVMVEITDDCLEAYGKWPWDRRHFARLVETLTQAGAKVISFDLSFFDHDRFDPQGDIKFAKAIQSHGRVVLASELTQKFFLVQEEGSFVIPSPDSQSFGEMRIEESLPLQDLRNAAHDTGFVNIALHDGVIRNVPLVKKFKESFRTSLGMRTVQSFLDTNGSEILSENEVHLPGYRIPFWDRRNKGNFLEEIFRNSVESSFFHYVAYLNFLGPSSSGAFFSESVSNILEGRVNLKSFQDKIVLVGFNAQSLDKKLTPFGVFPGMEIQATVMHNILNRAFLTRNSNLELGIFLLILTILLTYINFRTGWKTSFLLSLGATLFIFLGATIALAKFHRFIDLSPLLLQTWILFIGARLLLLSRSLRRRILHLQLLNQLSKKLFTLLDPDLLLQNIFEIVESYSGANRGLIMILDQITEQAEYSRFGEISDEFMVEVSNKNFRDQLIRHWDPNPVMEIHSALNPTLGDHVATPVNTKMLAIPLVLKDGIYGAIFALAPDFTRIEDEFDERFWLALSQIIVAAMENARLYKLATVDGLTGLFVRSFFDVQIQKEFLRATRYDGQVGFLMSDIDHFKGFNDQYGHDVGDRVLRMVSDQIKESVRNVDIAARYGGEELCVILPNTDREGSMVIAERIRQNIESLRIPHKDEELTITVSIGVSSIPENRPTDVKGFMKQADEALFVAKENGRNQVRYWESEKDKNS
ncbi:diguanylate cyclase [bacterium]|nr:diguanylate cyclase [bacterium]